MYDSPTCSRWSHVRLFIDDLRHWRQKHVLRLCKENTQLDLHWTFAHLNSTFSTSLTMFTCRVWKSLFQQHPPKLPVLTLHASMEEFAYFFLLYYILFIHLFLFSWRLTLFWRMSTLRCQQHETRSLNLASSSSYSQKIIESLCFFWWDNVSFAEKLNR